MTRTLLLVAMLALPALAAKPSFADVAKKFKPTALPLDSRSLKEGAALTPDEVAVLALGRRDEPGLGPLRTWTAEEDEGVVARLAPLASVDLGDVKVLVLRYASTFDLGTFNADYLLTFSSKGAPLGGVEFAQDSASEPGPVKATATLSAEGALVRREVRREAMLEAGLPKELVVTSESRHQLLASGKVQLGTQTFLTKDGAFVDRESKEELRVFGDAVFYRGNATKPFQRLLREGDAVRFKAGGKPYALSWDTARGVVTCQSPDGTTQTFTRER